MDAEAARDAARAALADATGRVRAAEAERDAADAARVRVEAELAALKAEASELVATLRRRRHRVVSTSPPPPGRGGGSNGGGCFVCGKVGHLARDCPDRNAKQRRSSAPALMVRGGMRGGTRGGPGRWGPGRFGRGGGRGHGPFGRMRGAAGSHGDERSGRRDRDRDRDRDDERRRDDFGKGKGGKGKGGGKGFLPPWDGKGRPPPRGVLL